MKKIITALLILILTFSLVACGSSKDNTPAETSVQTESEKESDTPETTEAENTEEEATETETTEAEPESATFEPVTAEFSQGTVEILGADSFLNEEQDYDVLRVYYRFTNREDISNGIDLLSTATQGGSELTAAYVDRANLIPEDTYGLQSVRPGVSVITTDWFYYVPDDGPIEYSFSTRDNTDKAVTVTFDPQNLPGAPDEVSLQPVTEPKWTEGLPIEADTSEAHVKIEGVEMAEAAEEGSGRQFIRVIYTVTNNGSEEKSAGRLLANYTVVYQDGMTLGVGYNTDYVHTDQDTLELEEDVAVGASITCSQVYELRSDSPIEVDIADSSTPAVGGSWFDLP